MSISSQLRITGFNIAGLLVHKVASRFFVFFSLFLLMGTASAGLFDDDEARKAILDIRQRIETIRQQLESKQAEDVKTLSDEDASIRRGMVDLQNQLNSARSEVEKLRGLNEQLMREIAEVQRRYKDSTQTLQERIRNLEPSKVTLDGQDFFAMAEETRDFNDAFSVFRNGDFITASHLFSNFLARYGKSGYRASTLFWLGNAQYANKEYKDALSSFRTMLALGADHVRAPEALLAVANCQVEMKDAKAAKKTWESLISTYPESEAAAAARDRLSRFK